MKTLYTDGGMTSIDNFDAALQHKKVDEKEFEFAIMLQGSIAWQPYGYISLVTAMAPLNSFTVIPWYSIDLYQAADSDIMEMLIATSMKYAKKHKEKEPWKSIISALESLQSGHDAP